MDYSDPRLMWATIIVLALLLVLIGVASYWCAESHRTRGGRVN